MSGEERFKVVFVDDLTPEQIDSYWINKDEHAYALVDTKTGGIVGDDRMEPEDALLVRDLDWVPKLLNDLASQLNLAREQLRRVEWVSKFDVEAGATVSFCPECYMWKEDGHASDCKLSATLEASK